MDDILAEFLAEAFDNMNVLDSELIKLERGEGDIELIGRIFRTVHTIKGTCGFLGLPRLEALTHAAENVLGKLRDGSLEANSRTISPVLKALDRVKIILDVLAESGSEPTADNVDLIAMLDAVVAGEGESADAAEPVAPEHVAPMRAEAAPAEPAEAPVITHEPVAGRAAEPETPKADGAKAPKVAADGAKSPKSEADGAKAPKGEAAGTQSLRVSVELLEELMMLVGELVLTRNQLNQMVRHNAATEFKAPLQRLSQITSELQEGVMKTRMQPISTAWSKFPRLVRDLAVELDKKIELKMIGAETELDRQVLEMIKDPLTHMVRNSVDHGLETPSIRKAAGKSEQGTITLNAFHEGGYIVIEIGDDGKGLDLERIRNKAIAQKLITEAEAASMTPQQVMQLIFRAGLSTAERITNVSGRGVGMDVVRANIEKIGGSIEIRSEVGKGSTFTARIPLTLAIVSALIVAAGGERFAVPQIGVVELVRAGSNSEHRIETIDGARILRLRDRLLPLVPLARMVGLEEKVSSDDTAYVLVAQVGNCDFGLIVDQIFDTEEIVVKPMSPMLKGLNVYSGNTILGDGGVVMILDLNSLAAAIDAPTGAGKKDETVAEESRAADEPTALLLFEAGGGGPKAVPMALVTRIEQVSPEAIEWSGNRTVVQYRQCLMPIADIEGRPFSLEAGRKPVLVFGDAGRSMGLAVDKIIDTIESNIKIERQGGSEGFIGSAIVAGRSTELLDVGTMVNRVFGGWFGNQEREPFEVVETGPRRILLVDDSAFIRNLLAPLLRAEGYEVVAAASPPEALRRRDAGEMFDLVISDIEMPEMNGFDFVRTCRASGAWQKVPFIALTSHNTAADMARGKGAGFDHHVGKLEKDTLLRLMAAAGPRTRAAA